MRSNASMSSHIPKCPDKVFGKGSGGIKREASRNAGKTCSCSVIDGSLGTTEHLEQGESMLSVFNVKQTIQVRLKLLKRPC